MKSNKTGDRAICIIIAVCLAVCLGGIFAPARSAKASAAYKNYPVIKGYFSYPSSDSTKDKNAVFYYSDGYFSSPSDQYDEHLSTMSLCMAMSAMNSVDKKDYYNKSANVRSLFDKLGFDDIAVNSGFVSKPTEDSIGVAIAKKEIEIDSKKTTVIPISIRGAGYEKEWISNMQVGTEGDAKGFSDAAKKAFDFLKKYIEKFKINTDDAVFWITGFSRGGAVTDILTKLVTDEYDTDGTRVYGYTFATPRAAYNSKNPYMGGHCIIHPLDLVPCVIPEYLGYGHFGQEIFVPSKTSDGVPAEKRNKQLEALSAVDDANGEFQTAILKVTYALSLLGVVEFPDGYTVDPTNEFDIPQNEFMDKIINMLAGALVLDRKDLTEKVIYDDTTFEDILSEIIRFMMTVSDEKKKKLTEEIRKIKTDKSGLQLAGISLGLNDIIKAVHEGYKDLPEDRKNEICDFLRIVLEPKLKNVFSDYEYQKIRKVWRSLVYVFMELAHYDYVHSDEKGLVTIGSIIHNMSLIGKMHHPELYLANLRCRDSYYNDEVESLPDKIKMTNITICDCGSISGEVYKKGEKIAEINNGELVSSDDARFEMIGTVNTKRNLQKDDTGELYCIPEKTSERKIRVGEGEYSITLSASEPDKDKSFAGWYDKEGKMLSSKKEFTIEVNDLKASVKSIKPVYKSSQQITNAKPGTDENTSGAGLVGWILGGVTTAAAGGGGYVVWRRFKKKS